MTDGLKVGLIFGGVAVAGYLIYRNSQAAALALPLGGTTPGGTTDTTAALTGFRAALAALQHAPASGVAPTAPATTAVMTTPSSGDKSGGISTLGKVASTFYNADKTIVKGTLGAGKAVIGGAVHVASSAVHSILSIF